MSVVRTFFIIFAPYINMYGMKRHLLFVFGVACALSAMANMPDSAPKDTTHSRALSNIEYKVEMQGSFSANKTPLWLNANKYGLSSLDKINGYVRGSVERPIVVDEGRKWGLGYGLDVAVPVNYTSSFVIQQAYVEGRWLHGMLTIGAKQHPMELKDARLSTGSQTLGVNARPIPQVRLSLPEYWTLPFFNGWLHLKGHIAYGMMTDDNWQHEFTGRKSKYADNVLYHSKAGYLKIGNEDVFCPWSVELGLEMGTTFGGTSYRLNDDGMMFETKGETGLKAFWNAFFPGGADPGEVIYQNAEGNQFGSWVAKISHKSDWNTISFYADKFFEDHSSMFQLDYDGYGEGEEWQIKKKRKYLLYDFKDWLLGIEYKYHPDNWINDFVLEYVYTKYQSGPIYHDHTQTIGDHIGGNDDFYNHYIYTGNQHWGQSIGNPLYRSPIYNEDGTIVFDNNRFIAYHLGLGGHPNEFLNWRFLATYQTGWGSYANPYAESHHNMSLMAEASYLFHNQSRKWLNGITVTGAYGIDFGAILGGINHGFQLTIRKNGIFKL